MSGVEVVGLVLGVVPLLISGMEHYGEGVRTIKRMANASDEFRKYNRTLQLHRTMFEENLVGLLQGEVDDYTLPQLLADHSHSYWSDPNLESCLKRRLGPYHSLYFEYVRAMDDAMKKLKHHLQIGDDGKGPFDAKNKRSVKIALTKITFGLRMKHYEELVNEVASNGDSINQITARRTAHEQPIRESRCSVPDFEKGRRYANKLFDVLQSRLAGSCTLAHRASLHMMPLDSSSTRKQNPHNPKRLRIIFHHSVPSSKARLCPSWTTSEAEVEPMDSDSDSDPDTPKSSLAPRRPAVRFASTSTSSSALTPVPPSLPEIMDLCASLNRLQIPTCNPSTCLGYLSHSNRHRHAIYSPPSHVVRSQKSRSALTLAQILDRSSRQRLSPTDKRLLALALASGMLRLHHTPWLAEQWGRHEVVLFARGGEDDDDDGVEAGVEAGRVYISAEISASPPTSTSGAGSAGVRRYFQPCSLIRERTVFALGILLIELALGKSFDACIERIDLTGDGERHELTDYCAADRLLHKVDLLMGERYGDVVRRCVKCEFDQRTNDLRDRKFREKVYDGVVAELQQEFENIFWEF